MVTGTVHITFYKYEHANVGEQGISINVAVGQHRRRALLVVVDLLSLKNHNAKERIFIRNRYDLDELHFIYTFLLLPFSCLAVYMAQQKVQNVQNINRVRIER